LGKKRKIGIIYNTTENWAGGKYYLDSIIAVIKKNDSLFDLYILSSKPGKDNAIRYLKYKSNIIERVFRKVRITLPLLTEIYLRIFRNGIIKKLMTLDFVFPVIDDLIFDKLPDSKKIYWLPDFQENYYPRFFEKEEIIGRIVSQVNVAYSKAKLVLSSNIAYNDFKRLYPQAYCDVIIMQFVSSLCFHGYNIPDYNMLREKYPIDDCYLICSNQFWIHKNHKIVIDAVSVLKDSIPKIKVFLSGKEYDYRYPEYALQLKEKIKTLNLESNVIVLGFISREEQIALIKYARAVIQPSLFEGWNTTIEDAKFLGKEVIASDIGVHREQLGATGYFFNPEDTKDLASIIRSVVSTPSKAIDYSYHDYYLKYQKKVLSVFS
jgi:glycosyltransferase involved in cell wall biosynthesis